MRRARKARATDKVIAEGIFVGIAMSVGMAVAHSCIAMDALDKKWRCARKKSEIRKMLF